MKVLVTFALENEFAPWRKMRNFARASANAWDHSYREQIDDAEIRVILTGAGRFASQRAPEIAFGEIPDVCIVSGLSGSLRAEHPVGAVVVARQITDSTGSKLIYADPELLSAAVNERAKPVERFLTSDHVVGGAAEKQQLGASADAVDMESLWILSAAAHHGVPAIAVRAISDAADANLPLDFDRIFNERGAVSIPKVMGQLATHPLKVGGLIRLAHDSERAASNLARFLDSFVQSLTAPPLVENANAAALSV